MAASDEQENQLSHITSHGQAHMVDVSHKDTTARIATAQAIITMSEDAFDQMIKGDNKKGDVLGTARIAGIMAAKETSRLIPLCHPLMISKVQLDLIPIAENCSVCIEASVKTNGQTGVEMEALTAASIGALTLYDMLKAVDKSMIISEIKLLQKSGGKSGDYRLSSS